MVVIVCLEGCHGSGKSTLCRQFEQAGYKVLDEAFLSMESFCLHPQTLTMETLWVSHWMERLLRMHSEQQMTSDTKRHSVFIADRSPYSAVLYAQRNGKLLEPLIRAALEELAEKADIHVLTVHIRVEPDVLWQRIQARLRREPQRAKFNEDSRAWMEHALSFYNDADRKWNFTVDNNSGALSQLMANVVGELRCNSPVWSDCATPEDKENDTVGDESAVLSVADTV